MFEPAIVFPSAAERRANRSPLSGCHEPLAGQHLAPAVTPANRVSETAGASFLQLPGTGPGGSIQAVLQKRMEHIANGHTPAADDKRTLKELTTKLRFYADDARAFAFNPRVDHDHAAMRNKLVTVGALALAAIDRLDRQPATGEPQ